MPRWKSCPLLFLSLLAGSKGDSAPEPQLKLSSLSLVSRLTADSAEITDAKLTVLSTVFPNLSGLPFSFLLGSQHLRVSQVFSAFHSTPFSLDHMRSPSISKEYSYVQWPNHPSRARTFLLGWCICFGGCLDSGESVCSLNLSATQSCSNYFQKVICYWFPHPKTYCQSHVLGDRLSKR